MKRNLSLASALTVMIAGVCFGVDQSEIGWVSEAAIRLDTVEVVETHADLMPLLESLAGVEIVALGEGTHGTRSSSRSGIV